MIKPFPGLLAAGGMLLLAGCHAQPSTPLIAAAVRGDTAAIDALLAAGVSVNQTGAREETALIWAARAGAIPAIRLLLSKGADPDLSGGVKGWTPMMHAIHKHQKEAMLALIDGGADVNARADSGEGETALMMAAGYGYAGFVQILLERGADPRAAQTTRGRETALDFAVSGVSDIDRFTLGDCQTATVKALLEKAPDLRPIDNVRGRAALWLSRLNNCSDVRQLLARN